ncbi:MAG: PCYCGC domain-containing protein [Acidobacteriota bacterium]|nr:PCYCGC domain-containing protein [Acidobacteriota bacterium]
MEKRAVGVVLVAVVILVAVIMFWQPGRKREDLVDRSVAPSQAVTQESAPRVAHVPAHYETAPSPRSLGTTLTPAKFFGKTKQAYEVAREIPVTLAQLPCYCHCDQSVGHKSLHSCFEDEHAASCAVCVDEALLAYKLEKSGKTPSQIREQIVAQYSMENH